MITDEKIVDLSRVIDDILASLCLNYEVSPLSLAAVVNARLLWACRETNNEEDCKKLLLHISGISSPETQSPNYSMH